MKKWLIAGMCCISTFLSWAGETAVDKDGMLRVDGQRRFILGLYEEARDDAFAREAADTGFNLIRVGANKEALDRAQSHGLQAWIPLGGLPVADETGASQLKETVEAWKSHPALAVWEAPDEALWNEWWSRINRAQPRWEQVDDAIRAFQGNEEQKKALQAEHAKWNRFRSTARYAQAEEVEEGIRKIVGLPPAEERLSDWRKGVETTFENLRRGCETVRAADPHHVIWFNHAPRNSMQDLTKYGTLADIVGCDIYPVPFGPDVGHSDLAERNLAIVGRFTERMAASVPGKPAWMVLQGFGWEDIGEGRSESPRPRPTYAQSRFMAYDAIVNGARGILYWGTAYIPKDSPLWADIKRLVSELHNLEPFLSAPDANEKIQVTPHLSSASDEKTVRWLAKEWGGRWAIVLVNESDSPQAFDIGGLNAMNGKQLSVLNGDETLTVQNGKVTFGLRSQTAEILVSSE